MFSFAIWNIHETTLHNYLGRTNNQIEWFNSRFLKLVQYNLSIWIIIKTICSKRDSDAATKSLQIDFECKLMFE